MGILGFVTERELSNARQLLDQHLTELESHTRELAKMNERLRRENERLKAMLSAEETLLESLDRFPVCVNEDCELRPLSEVIRGTVSKINP